MLSWDNRNVEFVIIVVSQSWHYLLWLEPESGDIFSPARKQFIPEPGQECPRWRHWSVSGWREEQSSPITSIWDSGGLLPGLVWLEHQEQISKKLILIFCEAKEVDLTCCLVSEQNPAIPWKLINLNIYHKIMNHHLPLALDTEPCLRAHWQSGWPGLDKRTTCIRSGSCMVTWIYSISRSQAPHHCHCSCQPRT